MTTPASVEGLPPGFALDHQPRRDPEGNPAVVTRVTYNGQPAGFVVSMFDRSIGRFSVVNSEMTEKFRGKGYGQAVYRAIHLHFKSRYGVGLASDRIRSQDANRMWDALKRKGLARGPIAAGGGGMVYVMEGTPTAWDALGDMSEGPLEDRGIEFSVSRGPITKAGLEVIQGSLVMDGRPVGTIRVTSSDIFPDVDGKPSVWHISFAGIDESLRGKGVGKEMYTRMRDYLLREFNALLASDVARSPESERLWRRFVQLGQAVYVPKGATLPGGESSSFDFYVMKRRNVYGHSVVPAQRDHLGMV